MVTFILSPCNHTAFVHYERTVTFRFLVRYSLTFGRRTAASGFAGITFLIKLPGSLPLPHYSFETQIPLRVSSPTFTFFISASAFLQALSLANS